MYSDHKLSLLSQQKICEDIIKNLATNNEEFYNELISKNAEIFSKLRSKFFPKEKLELYVSNYFSSFKHIGKPMTFVCILAHDTAIKELDSFIKFIKCFDDCIKLNIHFLLINWHKISNNLISSYDFNIFYNSFSKIVDEKLLSIGRKAEVTPLDIILNDQMDIIAPNIIASEFERLISDNIDEITMQDILWTLDFYQREDSLKNLSSKQALTDLAIRKSMSPYVHENIFKLYNNSMDFLITSELHKRIVKCYRVECAIFNISIED